MNPMQPAPEHKFAFGLRMMGRSGPDAFGEVARSPIEPCAFVQHLADLGAWGVSFRDDDLVPPGSTDGERADIVDRFRKTLDATGMVASMATTDMSGHAAFADGAFTASDAGVRRFALRKTMRAIDLGAECGAEIHVLGAREGVAASAAGPLRDAVDRFREAIDFLCGYVRDRGYAMRLALASRPGTATMLPTTGDALAFIATLDHAEMVGLSPEVGHGAATGAGASHGVAQALWSGKLFHIDLDAALIGLHSQGPGPGSGGIEDAFLLVKLLDESGYGGPRHFNAEPPLLGDSERTWDIIVGCMRTYLTLATKCRRFSDDPDIRDALEDSGALELAEPTVGAYSTEAARRLAEEEFDPHMVVDREHCNERLERLLMELLLGLR